MRGEALLLPRTRSVHTHFMRFTIDVVFLDDERHIVGIRPARGRAPCSSSWQTNARGSASPRATLVER